MFTLEEAERWSHDLWVRTAPAWSERVQDLTYRQYVSRPAWQTFFCGVARRVNEVYILDSGCGEGTETLFFRHELERLGCHGTLIAYEPQHTSALIAQSRCKADVGPHAIDIEVVTDLSEQPHDALDLLVSSYVLHDIADVEAYVAQCSSLVRHGGWAGFMIVHPHFVEVMMHKGAVREHAELELPGKNWIVALEYPIVEARETFYVPLFHRNKAWYMELLGQYFSHVGMCSLRVSSRDVRSCLQAGKLPFCDTPENVYYPEIVHMDSSLLFVCQK